MSGLGFYDEYLKLMGNLKDKPDLATPYKIKYLKNIIQNGKVYKFISFEENAEIKISTLLEGKIWFSFRKICAIIWPKHTEGGAFFEIFYPGSSDCPGAVPPGLRAAAPTGIHCNPYRCTH